MLDDFCTQLEWIFYFHSFIVWWKQLNIASFKFQLRLTPAKKHERVCLKNHHFQLIKEEICKQHSQLTVGDRSRRFTKDDDISISLHVR